MMKNKDLFQHIEIETITKDLNYKTCYKKSSAEKPTQKKSEPA